MKKIEDFKKIPLANWCIEKLGYMPNKKNDSRVWRSLVSPKGETIISKSVPNEKGHYLFSCPRKKASGSIIDLLISIEGHTLKSALTFLENSFDLMPNTSIPFAKEFPDANDCKRKAKLKMEKFSYDSRKNYLKNRGISEETLSIFPVLTNEIGAIFPLFLNGTLKSTILYNKKGKFFQKGLPRGLCFFGDLEKARRVVICESPVDALSYEQIKRSRGSKEELAYICTCGSISSKISQEIDRISKNIKKKIISAFDSDFAGNSMSKKLVDLVSVSVIRHAPLGAKDWNDLLNM